MSQHPFPNCRLNCDGQWLSADGHGTPRPCKCRKAAATLRLAVFGALSVGAALAGTVAWFWLHA